VCQLIAVFYLRGAVSDTRTHASAKFRLQDAVPHGMPTQQPAVRSKSPTARNSPKKDALPAEVLPADETERAKKAPPKPKPMGKKMKDGYWQGNLKLFKPNGKGIYEYNNGDKYEGTMVEGKRQTDANGNNRKAKYSWANGAKFYGQYVAHRCHGEGKLWFPDGTFVSTTWKKDVSALENFEFKNGDVYSGDISTWKMHGKGTLKLENGDSYEGSFGNNMFNGHGEYQCRSGDFYAGLFKDGSPGALGSRGESGAGEGYMTFANGDVYYGEFDSGVPHGKGQLRFADGDVVDTDFEHGKWESTHVYGNGDLHTGFVRVSVCPSLCLYLCLYLSVRLSLCRCGYRRLPFSFPLPSPSPSPSPFL